MKNYESRIKEANKKLDAARAKLYRPDGSPRYSPAEEAEKLAAMNAEYRAELDAIEADVIHEEEERQNRSRAARASSPIDAMTNAELERANALRPFIEEDVNAIGVSELADRVAASKDDRVKAFLYHRYAEPRLRRELEGDRHTVRENVALNRLSGALHEVSEALVTEDQRKALQAAETAEEEISPVRGLVSKAKVESGAYEETEPGMRVASVRDL